MSSREFPNYSLFTVDGSEAPPYAARCGPAAAGAGRVLTLARRDCTTRSHGRAGLGGSRSQYGLASLDDGRYYVTQDGKIVEERRDQADRPRPAPPLDGPYTEPARSCARGDAVVVGPQDRIPPGTDHLL